jgi:hypothetical protein
MSLVAQKAGAKGKLPMPETEEMPTSFSFRHPIVRVGPACNLRPTIQPGGEGTAKAL